MQISASFVDPRRLGITQPSSLSGKPHVTNVDGNKPVLNLNTVQGRNALKQAVRQQETIFVRVARTQVLQLDLSSPTTRRQVVKDIATILNNPDSPVDPKVKAGLLRVYHTLTSKSTGNFHEQLKPFATMEDLGGKVAILVEQFKKLVPHSSSTSLRHLLREANHIDAAQNSELIANAVTEGNPRFQGLKPEDIAKICSFHGVTVKQVEGAINIISANILDRVGTQKITMLQNPVGLLNDYFSRGLAFQGQPKVVGFEQMGPKLFMPRIEWEQGPRRDTEVICPKSTIQSGNDALALIQYFQHTLPTQNALDGCDARCNFMADVMEQVMGLKVEKIKLCTNDGSKFTPTDNGLFPAEASQWNMHTAPVITDAQGKKWIIDPALRNGQPVPLKAWVETLAQGKECTPTMCEGAENYVERGNVSKVNRAGVLDELSALHLCELVDNSKGRFWGDWKKDRGTVTVSAPSRSSEPRVIMSFDGEAPKIEPMNQGKFDIYLSKGWLKERNGVFYMVKGADAVASKVENLSGGDFEALKKTFNES